MSRENLGWFPYRPSPGDPAGASIPPSTSRRHHVEWSPGQNSNGFAIEESRIPPVRGQASAHTGSYAGAVESGGTHFVQMLIRNTTSLALAIVVIIISGTGLSQEKASFQVEGIVRDESGAPVPGAEVTLSKGRFRASQPTDREGRFHFPDTPIAAGTLTVRSGVFTPVQQSWDASTQGSRPIEITLAPKALTERVTVTATRTEQRVSDSASSVTVLSQEDLATSGGITLDDALGEIPGFMLYRRNGSLTANPTSLGVSLRGVGTSGASRALVISDGIPLTDPFGGWVFWDRVPSTSVGAVEVVEGGVSDLYGGDALGGVINVIPRRLNDSSLTLETFYGNEQTADASVTASLRRGPWLAIVSSEGFHTNGYVSVLPPLQGTVDSPVASEHIVGQFTLERRFSDQGRVFGRGSIFEDSRKNGTPLQNNDTRLRQIAVGSDWQSPAAGALTFRAYGGPEDYDQTFSSIAANQDSETLTDSQRVPSYQAGLSTQWTRTAGAHQTLAAGFDGQEIRGASNEQMYASGKVSSAVGAGGRERLWGLYGEDILRINTRWLITGGARVDDWRNYDALSVTRPIASPGPPKVTDFNDRGEQAFSPRLSTLFRAKGNLVFRASMYRAFRPPTLNELYRNFRQGNTLTLANSSLTAEQLTGAEAGSSYSAWHERLSVRGTLFWSDISDPIANVTLSTTSSLITAQRQNLGETRSRGAEIEAEARLSSNVTLSGGLQFVDATVRSFSANTQLVGLLVPHVPRHDINFQAKYSRPHLVTAALQGSFVGSAFDNDQNTLLLNHYFLLDALVSRPLGHGMEIFVAGENLLDQRYNVARTPFLTSGPPVLFRGGFRLTIR
jgi:outer membrane receptor protein involved in Fe transport